jgi:hypothetical protein
MKPLIEALTSTGSGRLEIVKESLERGAFNDLRIGNLAVKSIDDVYPELADFIADHLLPQYDSAIQPLIENDIDIKGRAGNVRRLRPLYRLDPEAARPIVLDAFENGSKEMKIAALGCLGDSKDDLPHLHEQARAKAKDVRRVALQRLSAFTDAQTIDLYANALASADVDLVVGPISQNKSAELLKPSQEAVDSQSSELLEGKAKTKLGKQLGRFSTLLLALRGRSDKQTVDLLQSLFNQRDRLLKLKGTPVSGGDVVDRLSDVMLQSNSPKLHKSLIDARDEFTEGIFWNCFTAAVTTLKPAEVYKLFSTYYLIAPKAKGNAAQRRNAIQNVILQQHHGYASRMYYLSRYDGLQDFSKPSDDLLAKAKWDPKWLSAAIKQDDLAAVASLATKKDRVLHAYLEKKLVQFLDKSSKHYEVKNVLAVMIRTDHPKVTEYWIDAVRKLAKKNQTYGMYWITRLIPQLPAAAGPKIEKIFPCFGCTPQKLPALVEGALRGNDLQALAQRVKSKEKRG